MAYKFNIDDEVAVYSICGGECGIRVIVYSRYVSDKDNHEAAPHNRYVCYLPNNNGSNISYHLFDVSENELGPRKEGNIDL